MITIQSLKIIIHFCSYGFIKKITVLKLELIKRLFEEGIFVSIEDRRFEGLKWLVDKKTNSDYIFGGYESGLVDLIRKWVKTQGVFYDLGAHWGYFSLLAAKQVGPKGMIYAFEPFPSNYEKLRKNIKGNGLTNVFAYNNAVADKNSEVLFTDTENSYGNNYVNALDNNTQSIKVRAISIDEFIKSPGIKSPTFMKIDVEGAELDVLRGCASTIKNHRPIIHLSTHEIQRKGVDKSCKDLLKELNYKAEEISSLYEGGIKDYLFFP